MNVVHRAALRADATAGEALHQRFVAHVQQQHRIQRLADFFQQRIQRIGLFDVAREAVEDETAGGVGPAQAARGSGRARCRRRPAGRRPSRIWPCLPSSVPRATASRSRSPEETCGTPYLACRRCACVPLPEPGAPSNTIRIIFESDPPAKERGRVQKSGAASGTGCLVCGQLRYPPRPLEPCLNQTGAPMHEKTARRCQVRQAPQRLLRPVRRRHRRHQRLAPAA